MRTKKQVVIALLASALTCVAVGQENESAKLEAAIAQARQEQIDVLAPDSFAAAVLALETAEKDRERGRDAQKIRAKHQESEAALQRANRAAATARQTLVGAIKAREDAVEADAPKHAPEAWRKANARFTQAMNENETGDARNAQKRAAEAEVLLREVEVTAIKNGMLSEARGLIAQADEAKVERWAPRSLAAAKRHLADAEQEIQRNRYELDVARRDAAEARYEANHALYLAKLIEQTLQQEEDEQAGIEALVLSVEEPMRRLAADMELAVQFDRGFQPPLKELGEHTVQQVQEIRRLKMEVDDREQRIAARDAQIARLETQLGGVSQERVALQRRVDAQEALRGAVAKVMVAFTPDEARVERQGDDVLVSLLGIKFPAGKSAIGPDSEALMQKVKQSLELFPGAAIAVEGHTDANGGDSANLLLSQDRADAVRQYLVTNFRVDPEKISSIGYGEARPVATNETPAGRTRNRRIDLIIRPDLAPRQTE